MQGFLFDLDGTLTDSQAGIAQCYRAALEALGIMGLSDAALRRQVGAPIPEVLQAFKADLSDVDVDRGIAAYRASYEREGIFVNALFPGVHNMLTRVRDSGRPAWIVTTKPQHFAEQVVDILQIRDLVVGIVGPALDEFGTKAPLIRRALQGTGLAPHQTVMLGDRHYDVVGALETGVAPVGALWGYGGHEELHAAGCRDFAESASDFTARFVT